LVFLARFFCQPVQKGRRCPIGRRFHRADRCRHAATGALRRMPAPTYGWPSSPRMCLTRESEP
jgi:hypothetical protein